jgi:hypothetical protein
MTYKKEIMDSKNMIFGVLWASISVFLGVYITKVIEIISMIMEYFINALSFIILFPAKVSTYINVNNFLLVLGIAIGVAILLAPITKKLLDWIIKVIRGSPL